MNDDEQAHPKNPHPEPKKINIGDWERLPSLEVLTQMIELMSNDQRYIPAANDVYDKVKKFISPNSKLTLTNENDNVIDKLNELIASEEEEGAFESLKQLIDQIFKDNNQFVIPDT